MAPGSVGVNLDYGFKRHHAKDCGRARRSVREAPTARAGKGRDRSPSPRRRDALRLFEQQSLRQKCPVTIALDQAGGAEEGREIGSAIGGVVGLVKIGREGLEQPP